MRPPCAEAPRTNTLQLYVFNERKNISRKSQFLFKCDIFLRAIQHLADVRFFNLRTFLLILYWKFYALNLFEAKSNKVVHPATLEEDTLPMNKTA